MSSLGRIVSEVKADYLMRDISKTIMSAGEIAEGSSSGPERIKSDPFHFFKK